MADERSNTTYGHVSKAIVFAAYLGSAITVVVNINGQPCQFAYAGISSTRARLAVKAWRYTTVDWTHRVVEHKLTKHG
jgi:hypothetical protein